MYVQLLVNIAICAMCLANKTGNDDYALELVHVTFRHGSRTPQQDELYVDNLNAVNNYHPFGYGQLTMSGKREAYQLGKFLHERYSTFLGSNRTTDTVLAFATDFDRTKMTLLLVLAALFPPTPSEMISSELLWQPIPYHYYTLTEDYIIFKPIKCPAFYKALKRILNSEEVQQFVEENLHVINHLERHSGKNMSELRNIFRLHQALDGEAHMNLTLPEWAKEVYPDEIKRLATQVIAYDHHTAFLKKIYSGRLFKVILNNMLWKSQGTLLPEERKIFLYSGHDNNIMGQLQTLGVFTPAMPNYCSAVIYELHRQKATNEYFVKVLYLKDLESGLEEKTIPGCELLCPLAEFTKILEPYLPGNITEECESNVLLEH